MNAIAIYEQPSNIVPFVPVDATTLLFLRAFIGTMTPIEYIKFGDVVLRFPYAFPRELQYLHTRMRRSQPAKTDKVIPLPAPIPYRKGQVVHILGSHCHCKVEKVFDRWGTTWVQFRHDYGVITLSVQEAKELEVTQ